MSLTLSQITELSNLKSLSGKTSLVTMYIPALSQMSQISSTLTKELSVAPNIKDKTVRNDVISALKSMQMLVKTLGHVAHEYGYVLLSGEPQYYF